MSDWKMTRIRSMIICFFLVLSLSLKAQENNTGEFGVLFYNVENLFDTDNDSLTLDDEFCFGGIRNWNKIRLNDKLNKIAKVILAANEFEMPALVGLAEVENRKVMERLVNDTPLKKFNYRIIHKDSPDERGIDVGILYRHDIIRPLYYKYHGIPEGDGATMKTREILEFGFGLRDDTFHIFVNHWPSRYNGQAETEKFRIKAAKLLRVKVDSLIVLKKHPKIIIVGDFNDEPFDISISSYLGALEKNDKAGKLINLSCYSRPFGTIKHRNTWQVFDQLIVSELLVDTTKYKLLAERIDIPFLLHDDEKWGGKKPFRTYSGMKYIGGFSDHLPVLLTVKLLD